MSPRRWTALALVAAAAACSDIASPTRSDIYEWRRIEASPGGSGLDSLTFHWPRERLPVRIWAEDGADLPANVARAIEVWRGVFLYREFDATVVPDSAAADVIVRAGPAPPTTQFARARLHSSLAPECIGATDLDISDDHRDLRLPIRVYVDPKFAEGTPGLAECLALTTAHELGHVIGIWRHSNDAADLMYGDPSMAGPSLRDIRTAQVLSHVTPNIVPVGP